VVHRWAANYDQHDWARVHAHRTWFFYAKLYLGPIHPGGNGRAYTHASGNYQAPYTTVAYTDPIPLTSSSLGFLPNHIYQNLSHFNAYGQPEAGGFGYETPP
jgi:hypothetical protein